MMIKRCVTMQDFVREIIRKLKQTQPAKKTVWLLSNGIPLEA